MKFSLATVLLLLATACTSLFAQEPGSKPPFDMPKQFSVDCVMSMEAMPDMKTSMKIAMDGEKMRGTMNMPQGKSGILVRGDTQKMYTLKEDEKKYISLPYNASASPTASMFPPGVWTKLGPEEANGVKATKYKLESNASGVPSTFFYWIDPATSYPTRMVMDAAKVTVDFSNFKAGPQPAALFELPADYTEEKMPAMPNMPTN
ncbi:MAG: DUF4412 domain-containing protein [Candidatus Methylacidiphilales bacterium]|nr:DUF4412 domain-containing protein [Candidatus Methylacidiphilales bacterium]